MIDDIIMMNKQKMKRMTRNGERYRGQANLARKVHEAVGDDRGPRHVMSA